MKAHELIQLLRSVPPDTDVFIYDEDQDILPVTQVTTERAADRRYRHRVPENTTDSFVLIV